MYGGCGIEVGSDGSAGTTKTHILTNACAVCVGHMGFESLHSISDWFGGVLMF